MLQNGINRSPLEYKAYDPIMGTRRGCEQPQARG